MALVLPSNNTGASSSKLVLPGTPEASKKLERADATRDATIETAASNINARRSFASRFAEELGFVGKEIAQGTARSFGAIGQTFNAATQEATDAAFKGQDFSVSDIFSKPFTPTAEYEKILFGDKPFSIRSQGEDVAPLLEKIGIAPETTKKFAIPIGLGLSLLDVVPGGQGKKRALETAADIIAKSGDEALIEATLKNVVKGEDDVIKNTARQLVGVNDAAEVRRIIDDGIKATANTPSVTLPATRVSARSAGIPPLDLRGRRILGQEPPRVIRKNEVTLLKERIRNLNTIEKARASGMKIGAQVTRDTIKGLQNEVIATIKAGLPLPLRGRHLVDIRNANSPKRMERALDRANEAIRGYQEAQEMSRQLGTRRRKQSFLTKIAELNQTAIRDIKNDLGIKKPIRRMDVGELDRMVAETQKRLAFKRERGLVGERQAQGASTRVDETEFQKVLETERSRTRLQKIKEGASNLVQEASGDFFNVLSTELKTIDPSLRNAIVDMERRASEGTYRGVSIVEELTKKLKKSGISAEEYGRLNFAFQNNNIDTVLDIAKKYGFTDEIKSLRAQFDDVLRRANDVDLEVERRENYFPRALKSDATTRARANEYFNRDGLVTQAFEDFEKKMGRSPDETERWKIINNLVRGFRQQGVTLSKTGSLKTRVLDEVNAETAPFYEDSLIAMNRYFESVNSLIEARRFFGKQLGSDLKNIDPDADLRGMVGIYVDKLIAEGKLTSPEQQLRLRKLLEARFTGGEMNKWLQKGKQIGYLTIMGDAFSALTQIGDLMPSLYQAGIRSTTTGLLRNLFRSEKQAIRLRDFGLEPISAEFKTRDGIQDAVSKAFRFSGLTRIDTMGKETFLNAVWDSYQRRITDDPRLIARIQDQMGELADATIADIKAGNITENVRQLMFSELSNFYPVTLSEVPVSYLRHPNGRIFYQMKTYTTKQLDIYRREIVQEMKKNPVQGIQNMLRMAGFLILLNASSDEIKNFIKGEDVEFSDKVIDNFLKLGPFNRYTIDQARTQGAARTAAEFILPPTTVFDDAYKDVYDFVSGKDSPGLRVTRDIPIGGELYYWWFGRGAETKNQSSSDRGAKGGIPTVVLPEASIPSVTIPSVNI